MAAESDTDDLTEEEEVEEKVIFLELDSAQEYGDNPHVEFLGLDQEKPLVNINGITYKGSWEDALGTLLLLEETNELESYSPLLKDDLNYILDVKYRTDKLLKLSRCVIVKKREKLEDVRTSVKRTQAETDNIQYSSDEENLDEYYSANIEPLNVKESESLSEQPVQDEALEETLEDEVSKELEDVDEDDDNDEALSQSQDDTDTFEQKGDMPEHSEAYDTTVTSDVLLDRSQALLSGLEDESYLYDYQTDSSAAGQSPGPSSRVSHQMTTLQVKTEPEPGCSKST